jgi:hypothetical protein
MVRKEPKPPGPNRQAQVRRREVKPTETQRETLEEHQQAWPLAGEAHCREPGRAT